MMQQSVNQRARSVPGAGVYDHARRLVHHNQVIVLVNDIERDILGANMASLASGTRDLQLVPLSQLRARIIHHLPAHRDRPVGNQLGQTGPRQVCFLWHIARNRLIKTLGGFSAMMTRTIRCEVDMDKTPEQELTQP